MSARAFSHPSGLSGNSSREPMATTPGDLESRMREIRLSGSEGGGPKPIGPPYPYLGRQL